MLGNSTDPGIIPRVVQVSTPVFYRHGSMSMTPRASLLLKLPTLNWPSNLV